MGLDSAEETVTVNMEVIPITGSYPEGRSFLILLEEITGVAGRGGVEAAPGEVAPADKGKARRDERVGDLEKELASAREYIQATSEEHEAVIEELRSAN